MQGQYRMRPRPVKFAAKWLGVSEEFVREAIRSGQLAYVDLSRDGRDLHGRAWRTTVAFLEEFVRARSRTWAGRDTEGAAASPSRLAPSTLARIEEGEEF